MALHMPPACLELLPPLFDNYHGTSRAALLDEIQPGLSHELPTGENLGARLLFEQDVDRLRNKGLLLDFYTACARWLKRSNRIADPLERHIEHLRDPSKSLDHNWLRQQGQFTKSYRLSGEKLRETPYGEVWRAVDEKGSPVAVGFLLPPLNDLHSKDRVRTFSWRINAMKKVPADADTAVMTVEDARDDPPFFASTDVCNATLQSHVARLTPADRLYCVERALRGLDTLHRLGQPIHHDDVNPDIILLSARGPLLGERRLLGREAYAGRHRNYYFSKNSGVDPSAEHDLWCAAHVALYALVGDHVQRQQAVDVLDRSGFDPKLIDALKSALDAEPPNTNDLATLVASEHARNHLDSLDLDLDTPYALRWLGTYDPRCGKAIEELDGNACLLGYQPVSGDLVRRSGVQGLAPNDGISWRDAALICDALSVRLKLTPAYRGSHQPLPEAEGFRLPSLSLLRYAVRRSLVDCGAKSVEWTADLHASSPLPGQRPVSMSTFGPAMLSTVDADVGEWTMFERATTRLPGLGFRLMLPPSGAWKLHARRLGVMAT